uniref:Uncharacterized protein n=1 Tax=Cacopsylla melanoneura TaxID=428564 RepID=A0A8D9F698_9HEMI
MAFHCVRHSKLVHLFQFYSLFYCGCFSRPAAKSGVFPLRRFLFVLIPRFIKKKMDLKSFVSVFLVILAMLISFEIEASPTHVNGMEETVGNYVGYEAYDPTGYLNQKQATLNWMSPPDPNYTKIYLRK